MHAAAKQNSVYRKRLQLRTSATTSFASKQIRLTWSLDATRTVKRPRCSETLTSTPTVITWTSGPTFSAAKPNFCSRATISSTQALSADARAGSSHDHLIEVGRSRGPERPFGARPPAIVRDPVSRCPENSWPPRRRSSAAGCADVHCACGQPSATTKGTPPRARRVNVAPIEIFTPRLLCPATHGITGPDRGSRRLAWAGAIPRVRPRSPALAVHGGREKTRGHPCERRESERGRCVSSAPRVLPHDTSGGLRALRKTGSSRPRLSRDP
jgi:hypothetical protein